MQDRVRRVFEHLEPTPDALIIANSEDRQVDTNFFYLFDASSGAFEGNLLVAKPDGSVVVLTDPLEEESAREVSRRDPSVELEVCRGAEEQSRVLHRLVDGRARVGLDFRELTQEGFCDLVKDLPTVRWFDASAALQRCRRVKDASEIKRLEKAASIASAVAGEIPSLLRAGMTELDLAGEVEFRMAQAGASGRSFETIVGFGPHSAEPHFSPGQSRLERGQPVVCDFGALYRRYCSDITRPFHFGPADPELDRVHRTVAEAQQAALDVLKAGVRACDVHEAAQAVIDRSPWKGRFTHRLGHSLGLAVHDGFSVNRETTDRLEAGEVVTIEPGIYLPGTGGVRIEDDVLVTASGYRLLTTASREYLGPSA